MKFEVTSRNFFKYNFSDHNGEACMIQESSLAGVQALWFGAAKGYMHLTREQLRAVLPILRHFVNTGELPNRELQANTALSHVWRKFPSMHTRFSKLAIRSALVLIRDVVEVLKHMTMQESEKFQELRRQALAKDADSNEYEDACIVLGDKRDSFDVSLAGSLSALESVLDDMLGTGGIVNACFDELKHVSDCAWCSDECDC